MTLIQTFLQTDSIRAKLFVLWQVFIVKYYYYYYCYYYYYYLISPHQSKLVFMYVLFPDRIGIWSCRFLWWEETVPVETPSGQDENQQQTYPTNYTGPG